MNGEAREGALGRKVNGEAREGGLGHKMNATTPTSVVALCFLNFPPPHGLILVKTLYSIHC